MKYLKIFEEYKSYETINEFEFDSRFGRFVPFPLKIYNELEKLIDSKKFRLWKSEKLISSDFPGDQKSKYVSNSIEYIGITDLFNPDPYDRWWIRMDDDDWFWIAILSVSGVSAHDEDFYKCDSKSGLYELLKHKRIIE